MIKIRDAAIRDIDDFKHVIEVSIREQCRSHYSPQQINSLLAQYPENQVYKRWIQERILLVAEGKQGIVGFAQYFPPHGSLEAIHVLPDFSRQGIGKGLLEKVEALALDRGARKISLGASLNAVGFYERCGYQSRGPAQFRCNDGAYLQVVCFEKALD